MKFQQVWINLWALCSYRRFSSTAFLIAWKRQLILNASASTDRNCKNVGKVQPDAVVSQNLACFQGHACFWKETIPSYTAADKVEVPYLVVNEKPQTGHENPWIWLTMVGARGTLSQTSSEQPSLAKLKRSNWSNCEEISKHVPVCLSILGKSSGWASHSCLGGRPLHCVPTPASPARFTFWCTLSTND